MGQDRSSCMAISQYIQVIYIHYKVWLDEVSVLNMAALREGRRSRRPLPREWLVVQFVVGEILRV